MRTKMLSIVVTFFLTAFLFLLPSHHAQAAICTWNGTTGNWNDSTRWSCGDVPGVGDEAVINNGSVSVTADAVVGTLTLAGGELTGAFNLSAGTINWDSGTMSGSGSTTATDVANFTGSANIFLTDRTFNNADTAIWNKTNYMNMNPSAIFNNQAGATFTIQTSGQYVFYWQGTFNNYGTITKTSAGNTNFTGGFNNSATGMVNIETEMLELTNTASSTISGAFHVQSGATLRLNGTNNLSGDVTFSGTGTVDMVGSVNLSGTYAFTGTTNISSGTLNLSTGSTATTLILNMSGGTLTGSGDLSAGTINWDSGTMSGSGSTTATDVANFTGSANIFLTDRTFNNADTAIWNKTNYMNMNPSAIFNNQAGATFTIQTSGQYVFYWQGTFNNYGTLNLTTGNLNVTTFRQEAGGVTNLAIRGTTPGIDYSQMNASDYYLNGLLNISFTGGYTPQVGDHFILLDYSSSRTGDFSPVHIAHVEGIDWYLFYENNTLNLWAIKGLIHIFIPIISK
jgi:hypothetical protein